MSQHTHIVSAEPSVGPDLRSTVSYVVAYSAAVGDTADSAFIHARSPALLSTKVRSSGRDERQLARLSERTLVSTLSISYGTANKAANADLGNACVCVGTWAVTRLVIVGPLLD